MAVERTPMYHKAYSILVYQARIKEPITFTRLARELDLPESGQYMSTILGNILNDIYEEDAKKGQPPLSAVVVRSDSGEPSRGFFRQHYKHLGLTEQPPLHKATAIYKEVVDKLFEYWG